MIELEAQAGAGASGSAVAARTRAAQVLVGKKAFTLPPGARAVIHIPLTKRGKQLLKASGKHGLKVTVAGSGIKQRTLVLKSSS